VNAHPLNIRIVASTVPPAFLHSPKPSATDQRHLTKCHTAISQVADVIPQTRFGTCLPLSAHPRRRRRTARCQHCTALIGCHCHVPQVMWSILVALLPLIWYKSHLELKQAVQSITYLPRLLPRDAMHKRGLCHHAVSVCLSVRLSFCLSVTFVYSVETNLQIFSPSDSHTILVFP